MEDLENLWKINAVEDFEINFRNTVEGLVTSYRGSFGSGPLLKAFDQSGGMSVISW